MIEKVGPVAYRLALPPELENIHNVPCVNAKDVQVRPITCSLFKDN